MRRSRSVAGASEPLGLAPTAIGVARLDALGGLDGFSARLQARDRARLATMGSDKRRRELLAGRWLLQALAVHCGLPPVMVDSADGAAGVVVCAAAGEAADRTGSVSHSGGWIAGAIGNGQGVGIDLEVLADRDFLALAEAAFPEDVAALTALTQEARTTAFYRRWTQYEAGLKRGGRPGRHASWLLPGEWVLSVQVAPEARPIAQPLLWDDRAGEFRSMALEALP